MSTLARMAPGAARLALPVIRLLERLPPSAGSFVALTWHRVDEPGANPDRSPGLLSATPHAFAEQVRWLAQNRTVVRARAVAEALSGGDPLPAGAVLLTFDDAADDLARHIWPILSDAGLPGVAFVPTGFPDTSVAFWWDRLWDALRTTSVTTLESTPAGPLDLSGPDAAHQAFRALRGPIKSLPADEAMAVVDRIVDALGAKPARPSVLSWGELERLAGEGLELAPHGRTHAMLDRLPADAAREEVAGSWSDLRERVPDAVPVFAYPSGQSDSTAAAAVREAGLVAAFGTARGHNRLPGADRWNLRRINIGGRTTGAALRAQLVPTAGALLGRRLA